MHTVAYTHAFLRAASSSGMSEDEIEELVMFLAENPTAGTVIKGTGGCRKVRVARSGRGKSGGFRTVTFYSGEELPVFLITVFSKGEKADLTKSERNSLKSITTAIVDEYQSRVTTMARKGV